MLSTVWCQYKLEKPIQYESITLGGDCIAYAELIQRISDRKVIELHNYYIIVEDEKTNRSEKCNIRINIKYIGR